MADFFDFIFNTALPALLRFVGQMFNSITIPVQINNTTVNVSLLAVILGLCIVGGVINLVMSFRPSVPADIEQTQRVSTKLGDARRRRDKEKRNK